MTKRGTDPAAVYRTARQHFEKGRFGDARKLLLGLAAQFPHESGIARMLGAACCECHRFDEGVGYLLAVCEAEPTALDYFNLGKALQLAGRPASALKAHEAGLKIAPGQIQLMQARALTLDQLGRRDEALVVFQQVLSRDPDFVEALTNQAAALVSARRYKEAAGQIQKAVALEPGNMPLVSALVRMRMLTCDWSGFADNRARVARYARRAGDPFFMMMYLDDPAKILEATQAAAQSLPPPRPSRKPAARPRIKVGYVSADIRAHATARLLAGVIEAHDTTRFEVVAVSNGPPDDSPGRARIQASASQFVDLFGMAPAEQLAAMDALELDIAVDLMGHTTANSATAFALRIAPVQVAFLGYPGTTGIDAMDYIVLDPFIATQEVTKNLTEKAALLPHCYQANDPQRPHPPAALPRAAYGLPAEGTIFAAFNDASKITPEAFASWMRILAAVPASVLWLYTPDWDARANLRDHATGYGIDAGRLIFADTLPQAEHLARYLVADILLDTFPCGGHTTASDALWMGCPVVTLAGTIFAGRVAGSLLTAAGFPELVTATLADYEAVATGLALDRARLAAVRSRLAEVRATTPVFDATRFARDLERAYAVMWTRALQGGRPKAFRLDPEA